MLMELECCERSNAVYRVGRGPLLPEFIALVTEGRYCRRFITVLTGPLLAPFTNSIIVIIIVIINTTTAFSITSKVTSFFFLIFIQNIPVVL